MRKKTLVTQHRSNHKAESEILTSYLCFLRISLFIKFRGESDCQCRRRRRCGFDPWVGKIAWSRKWQPLSVFLPGKFHKHGNLVGCSSYVCTKSFQLCLTLCNPIDCSPPGSSVHGDLPGKDTRVLAMLYSRGSS